MSGLGVGKGLVIAMTWMKVSVASAIVMRMVVGWDNASQRWSEGGGFAMSL